MLRSFEKSMQTIFGATEPPPGKAMRNQMFPGLCIGALSGAITSVVELAADDGFSVLRVIGTPYLIGCVFGVVFGCWLWIGTGKRALFKVLGFSVGCAAAYNAAWFVAVFSVGIFGGGDVQKDSRMIAGSPAGSFFLSGTVGGFIVLAAALFLFSEERRLLRLVARAAAFSPLGGAFGLAAWGICSILISPRPTSAPSSNAFELILLWLVWQSGMGALLGDLLVPEHRPNLSTSSVPERRAGISLKTVRALLILLSLASVTYFVVPDIPSEIQAARSQRAYKKHLSEEPSPASVPLVQQRPAEQVLILREFGQYHPGKAAVVQSSTFVVPKAGSSTDLTAQWYRVRYQPKEEPVYSPKSYVDVAVVEFPSPAWAKYEVGTLSTGLEAEDIYAAGGMAHTRIFSGTRQPNGSGLERYVWTSGAFVIEVRSNWADARCAEGYLEKYPSTL